MNQQGTNQSNAETNSRRSFVPFNLRTAKSKEKSSMARFLLKDCQAHLSIDRQPVKHAIMSKTVKTKIAGMLRGLLRRLDDGETVVPETPRFITPAVAPVTVVPVAAPPPQMAAPAPLPAGSANELQLPLQPIIASLPMELRAKVMQTPPAEMVISVPLEKVLTQLARGAVKITFGELRTGRSGRVCQFRRRARPPASDAAAQRNPHPAESGVACPPGHAKTGRIDRRD